MPRRTILDRIKFYEERIAELKSKDEEKSKRRAIRRDTDLEKIRRAILRANALANKWEMTEIATTTNGLLEKIAHVQARPPREF